MLRRVRRVTQAACPVATQERQEAYPMDALERSDQVLARAKARRADIVTPDSATSPMDQADTVQIPRVMVVAADPRTVNPNDTIIPTAVFGRKAPEHGYFGPDRPHR
jgi:hypothetical protein